MIRFTKGPPVGAHVDVQVRSGPEGQGALLGTLTCTEQEAEELERMQRSHEDHEERRLLIGELIEAFPNEDDESDRNEIIQAIRDAAGLMDDDSQASRGGELAAVDDSFAERLRERFGPDHLVWEFVWNRQEVQSGPALVDG